MKKIINKIKKEKMSLRGVPRIRDDVAIFFRSPRSLCSLAMTIRKKIHPNVILERSDRISTIWDSIGRRIGRLQNDKLAGILVWTRMTDRKKRTAFAVFLAIIFVMPIAIVFYLTHIQTVEAAWWDGSWGYRKQLTLVNNSGDDLAADTTYSVNIDTKEFYDDGNLQPSCEDLRVVFHDGNTITNLPRYADPAASATNCSDSESTKVYFSLQEALTDGSETSKYYVYYANPTASAPSDDSDAFDIGSKDATLALPFAGDTTGADGETPSTESGAIRYGGGKSALNLDGVNDYTDHGTSSTLDFGTGDFTIEFWIKPSSMTGGKDILSKWEGGVGGYSVSAVNGVPIIFVGGNSGRYRYCGQSTVINQWMHVAFIKTGTTHNCYQDGVLSNGAAAALVADTGTATSSLYIGGKGRYDGYSMELLDEVRISDVVRYTSNFTPSTDPFVRDENTKLLLHFDENGDDPRNSGKAIDDSGNGNDGTITGAKYVAGLVGVDASSSDTGYLDSQSYASREGIFIEEGTTNKITNPSFDHSTYDTAWDAVGANLTVTEETSTPYYKFGSKSAKIVASGSGDNNFTIGIDPDSTANHTLSAYIYNGTSGVVGGTVDNTVAQLVWEGSAQSGATYTDMGGGWWRIDYTTTTTDLTNEYGLYVLDGKTVYLDGVQLEELAYATTYCDGTLGDDYSWSGTAHESSSSRTAASLIFSATDNFDVSAGSVSFWVKPLSLPGGGERQEVLFDARESTGVWEDFFLISSHSWNNTLYFRRNSGGCCGNLYSTGTTAALSVGNWYHVIATWDSTSGMELYLNNTAVTPSSDTDNWPSTINTLYIGDGNYQHVSNPSDSVYSDFQIFDTALSDTEIADLYYAGLGSHEEGSEIEMHQDGEKGDPPLAYWKLDEGYGSTTYDSSDYGNDGTISDGTWQSEDMCANGKCLYFDGTDDYVDMGSNINPDSLTICLWLRTGLDNDTENNKGIIGKYDTGESNRVFSLFHTGSSENMIGFVTSSDGSYQSGNLVKTTSTIHDNQFHYICAVYDTTYNRVYFDGNLEDSVDRSNDGLYATNEKTVVGGFLNNGSVDTGNTFNGFIDDVKIYPYARSAAQVKADYARGAGASGSAAVMGAQDTNYLNDGLLAYWKMDESAWDGTPDEVVDSSGNGNHGVRAGDATTANGRFGNGGSFDGDSDYVSTDWTDHSGARTYVAWIKYTGSGIYSILHSYNVYYNFQIRVTGTALRFTFRSDSNFPYYQTSISSLNDDNWHQVVLVHEWGDSSNTRFYVDGVLRTGSWSGDGDLTLTQTTPLWIGFAGWASYFPGSIDEVRIYNRALSEREVRDLYNWAPGPVAHWKMDEKVSGDAQTIYDTSTNENNGTTAIGGNGTGMDCTKPGKYGSACEFDGTDDYVSVTDDNSVDIQSGGFTVSCWIKPAGFSSNNHIVFKGSSQATNEGYQFRITTDQKLNAYVSDGSTWTLNNHLSSGTISQDVWTHVAWTLERDGYSKFYINGQLDATTVSFTDTSDINATNNLILGSNGSSVFNDGSIDDLRIYKYARTQGQIIQDMNAGHPAPGSPVGSPVGYWKMDEGYGDTTYDSGTGDNDGDLAGSCPGEATCPSWSNSGKYGKTLDFDGTDDYLDVTADSSIDLKDKTGYTVCSWINPDSDGELDAGEFWSKGDSYIRVDTESGGTVEVSALFALASSNATLNTTQTIATGSWSQVCVTWEDDSDDELTIYINGVSAGASVDGSGSPADDSASDLYIGGDSSNNFDGEIDEVKIYNFVLTEDEVRMDYNHGKGMVMGSLSTESDGSTASYASDRSYCIPGDTSTCNPPIAEWKLEEGTGTSVYDTSGNDNTGTLQNQSEWVSGKYGKGAWHDGQSDGFNFSNPGLNGAYTIEYWVKPDNAAYTYAWNDTEIQFSWINYGLRLTHFTCTNFYLYHHYSGSTYTASWPSHSTICGQQWHHWALTYNSTDTAILYIDGVSQGEKSIDPPVWQTTGGNNRFFNYASSDNAGSYDQVQIYNYARTPAQIAWDYNRGAPVGWWKMNECSGVQVDDWSGNANHGTVTIGGLGTQDGIGTCTDGDTSNARYNGREGKWNSSINFDGTDDKITVTDPSGGELDFGTDGDFSLFAWIKGTDSQGGVVTKRDPDPGTLKGYRLYIYNGKPYNVVDTTGTNCIESTDVSTVNDGDWHLIGFVANRDSSVKFYTDGVLVDTCSSATNDGTVSNDEDFKIGVDRFDDQFYDGQIDDVGIYNYALTEEQVKSLYNHGQSVRFGPEEGTP